jgi:fucose permease
MTRPSAGRRQVRSAVPVSYAAFVLLGIGAGAGGVLLPSQMAGYGVDRATIGISFFTISAGWVLAGMSSGALIHRFGVRIVLMTGGGAYLLSGLYLATRPPFVAFVLVQVLTGYGAGVLESALNVYLTSLPGATTLLNRLHAFWGAGALLGPPLATWILGFASWTVVWLVLAAACVPLLAGFLVTYRGEQHRPLRRKMTEVVRRACWVRRCGTAASSSARRCWLSTSAWKPAWATGASATWCRRGGCRSRWPATRSAGTGWG